MRRLIPLFSFGFFLYLCFVLTSSIYSTYRSGDRVNEVELKLAKLKKENEVLKAKLNEVSGDQFVEKEARDKLGMAREGEIIVIMPSIVPETGTKEVKVEEVLPNWKKWVRLFTE